MKIGDLYICTKTLELLEGKTYKLYPPGSVFLLTHMEEYDRHIGGVFGQKRKRYIIYKFLYKNKICFSNPMDEAIESDHHISKFVEEYNNG